MPYLLSTPKTFATSRVVDVDITRLGITGFQLNVEPILQARVEAELQSGTGPYTAEHTIYVELNAASTGRILNSATTGVNKVSQALERAVFDELAVLNKIPTGTVT